MHYLLPLSKLLLNKNIHKGEIGDPGSIENSPNKDSNKERIQPVICELLKHLLAMLLFNQAFHDYTLAFGFNFKPDVDPFTSMGVFNFNESPIASATLMATSKTGVLYLSVAYIFLAHGGSSLPLFIMAFTAAVNGIVLHEMVWRYMMSNRLIDVALHTVAVATMGLLYAFLMVGSWRRTSGNVHGSSDSSDRFVEDIEANDVGNWRRGKLTQLHLAKRQPPPPPRPPVPHYGIG